jgi:hypothetical protein
MARRRKHVGGSPTVNEGVGQSAEVRVQSAEFKNSL